MPQLNPLLEHLEKIQDINERKKKINAPGELPEKNISCRNCTKAKWFVLDRNLTCYCRDLGRVAWASTQTNCSIKVTECDEPLIQEMKEKHAKLEQREALASGLSEEEVLAMPVLTKEYETPRHAESQKKITR